ncbi:hypothetical protein ACIQUQ_12255 [Streptomyces sp. NPDC101118]|uniref:hypothetical protein n=1 Tax=Streptomyces sp. NPDC101118 TaxID=3366109 RepID=UPI0038178F06
MRRHEFQPGRLIAGIVLLVAGVLFAVDARGGLEIPWWVLVPMIGAGLSLAALAGWAAYIVRRGQRREEAGEGMPSGPGRGY